MSSSNINRIMKNQLRVQLTYDTRDACLSLSVLKLSYFEICGFIKIFFEGIGLLIVSQHITGFNHAND